MSISKIVIPNFVWVVQMKDTKHTFFCISRDFHSVTLVMSQGCDFGAQGSPGGGVKNVFFFFKNGHVAYQTEGDDEQNKMQENFSS